MTRPPANTAGYRPIAILVAVLAVLGVVPAIIMAGLSVMAFDAPGSTESLAAWAWFALFFSTPVLALITAVLALICATRPSHRLFWWMLAPAIAFTVLFVLLAIATGL